MITNHLANQSALELYLLLVPVGVPVPSMTTLNISAVQIHRLSRSRPPSLQCLAHVGEVKGGDRNLNREVSPPRHQASKHVRDTPKRDKSLDPRGEPAPSPFIICRRVKAHSQLHPSLASSTCRRRCGPGDSGRGMSEEALSLLRLLAAIRRENHLWHSGDSFVTLTVMLLCAGLTHRMNP